MKRKFTTLLFGLLLAVGWTNDVQAQLLAKPTVPENLRHSKQEESKTISFPKALNATGSMRAPQRTPNTIEADEVRSKDWWSTKNYTWYDSYPSSGTAHTASFTEPATDPYQMMYMVKEIYTNPLYPGIQYDEVYQTATPYPGIGYGWDIEAVYDDFVISFNNSYAYFYAVTISDYYTEEEIESWSSSTSSSSVGTLPSWLTPSKTIQKTDLGGWSSYDYGCYMSGGGTLTIKGSSLSGHEAVTIAVTVRTTSSGGGTLTIDGITGSMSTSWQTLSLPREVTSGITTPPDYNGYTVMLVKVKNDATDFPVYTTTATALKDSCFSKYESIELLTDGLRVGSGSSAGTVFAYTGDLNRFFFIGKGKTAQWNAHAPFYEMYEEFSPTTVDEGAEITDFYEKMKQGDTYGIQHDCQSVSQMEHYFSMSGKSGTTVNRVNSLVLYIPDDRSTSPTETSDGYISWSREYDDQPTVGMYMIDLYADIEPSTTPDYYTVTVNWYDNLDDITHSDGIPQTYTLYEIMDHNNDGVIDTIPVYTGPLTTYQNDFPVGDPRYYDISYYVVGTPTAATNPDTFFAKSNTDDVTVPGKDDFLGLQWWRYESDYVTKVNGDDNHEVNYYRNFLAPHALAVQGEAGINAGNVGTTGRTLTLYRGDGVTEIPIFNLELKMNGNKAYYRIKHVNRQANQQVEPGYSPETGERTSTNN